MRRTKGCELNGRVALISGGARGLGKATAWAICEAGGAVVIGDLLTDRGAETVSELRDAGHRAQFVFLDVCDQQAWENAVARALEDFGRLDILVNNAGIVIPASIEDMTRAEFQKTIDINLMGAFLGMQAAIPVMKAAGGGSIINIASNSTQQANALGTAYAASKAALASLTKSAAIHLAQTRTGIRVNSVHPGPHATDILDNVDPAVIRALSEAIPMGRTGAAEELGAVVAFLASDAASYVTAAELFVDGGATSA